MENENQDEALQSGNDNPEYKFNPMSGIGVHGSVESKELAAEMKQGSEKLKNARTAIDLGSAVASCGTNNDSIDPITLDVANNKALRRSLDNDLQFLKELPRSRERSLAITKLQECIMWLGMDLKRLNEPNPYPTEL